MSNKITEYDIQSAIKAEELYNAAVQGKISYTEAWYNLPAPAPIVGMTKIANWVNYNIDYKYLSDFKICHLKKNEEEEYQKALDHISYIVKIEQKKDEDYKTELKERMKGIYNTYEGLTEYVRKAEQEIEKIKHTLKLHEDAYTNTMQALQRVIEEKEQLENSSKAYKDSESERQANMLKEARSKIDEYNRIRDEGLRRQQM